MKRAVKRSERPQKTVSTKSNKPSKDSKRLAEIREVWGEEASKMIQLRFKTLDQALDHLATSVASRLGLTDSGSEATRDFIRDLISSHPEITEKLRSVLKLKE